MLQDLGDKLKNRRIFAALILGPIALIFIAWGATGVVNLSFGSSNYALKVNGDEVSLQTMQQAWQDRQSRYQQMLRAEIPAAQQKVLQDQLMQEYISRTLIRQRAEARGFRISEAQVFDAYRNEPEFQVDGKFDVTKARAALAQADLTVGAYEEQLRDTMQSNQLVQGIGITGFLTPSEKQRIIALENEQRSVRFAELPLAKYSAAAKIDDAAIKAWYESHASDYQTPEWAALDYAELSLTALAAEVKVDDAALAKWFEQNAARYGTPERRRAAHILIAVPVGADAAADAAARAKAEKVLAEERAGKDFGALAKEYSADTGSAGNGGDVGWTEAKGAFDQAFTDALFKLGKKGDVSEPVRTQYGYHIIKLTDLQPAGGKTLATARTEVENDYRRDMATERFGDLQERLQEKLEAGGDADLAAFASEFGLKTGSVDHYTRANGGPLGTSADLANAVFAEDVRNGSRLSPPVALGNDRIVVVKVRQYHPVGTEPLAAVRDSVIAALRKDLGTKAAVDAAEIAVKKLRAGASFDATVKELGVTSAPARDIGRGDPDLPVQIRDAAFALPPPAAADKPSYEVVGLDEGGAALLALYDVKPGKATDSAADQRLLEPYAQREQQAELRGYLQELQNRADIKRNMEVFN